MDEIITLAEMRAAESAAMAGGVPGLTLMQRAAEGVVEAIRLEWPALGPVPVVVLCGPGNNGGDGYAVAHLLRDAGHAVRVIALAPPATPDAQVMAARWGGPVEPPGALDRLSPETLVVDALFGTGLTRPLAMGAWGLLALVQESGCRVVAIDILSGINADTGAPLYDGAGVDQPVALTVTFHRKKPGHLLEPGASLAGMVRVADIGLPAPRGDLFEAAPDPRWQKLAGHKFSHGHCLVIGGEMAGAARLAARAALRVGAGLVTLAGGEGPLPDAIMRRTCDGPEDLAALLRDARITALCLGPGLGKDRAAALLPVALASGRALLLDADALALLPPRLPPRCLLTPHEGEFARLFPQATGSKLDRCRAAARALGATVLLKGPDTVIAAPTGEARILSSTGPRAVPWLATAGSGDVLAGLCAGLLARGLEPLAAAETAAFLHAEAGRLYGPGLIADDLPEMIPAVFQKLAV